eukprot:scaffold21883_cov199-Amphora_coffeaeformis.AAC.1
MGQKQLVKVFQAHHGRTIPPFARPFLVHAGRRIETFFANPLASSLRGRGSVKLRLVSILREESDGPKRHSKMQCVP